MLEDMVSRFICLFNDNHGATCSRDPTAPKAPASPQLNKTQKDHGQCPSGVIPEFNE